MLALYIAIYFSVGLVDDY